jgi:ribosome-associated translation inhibitor RaiA
LTFATLPHSPTTKQKASITLEPRVANKAAGTEAFVRMGQLKASEPGDGWEASLDNALASLEKKLHTYTKAAPKKVDYRRL